jgi:dienelactone hydrolase
MLVYKIAVGLRCWAVIAATCMGFAGQASAQVARIELHVLQSETHPDRQFLRGEKGTPVAIGGELRIPKPGSERLPAVVLLHGSGGVGNNVDHWVGKFRAAGVATLVIDSFTGRGIMATGDDQDRLSRLAMIVDAYRALDILARHPRVDPGRIYLMGFSRGGGAAHYAAVRRFHAMHARTNVEFAGYVSLYPTCNRVFLQGVDVFDKPVRIFHGAADDYVPAHDCRLLVERLAGKDVKLVEFPGALHVYDNPASPPLTKLPNAQTTRNCPLIEEIADGVLVNSATRQPFSYRTDPCVERGVSAGYNAAALVETEKAVMEVVTRVKP